MLNDNDTSKRGHEYPINRAQVSALNSPNGNADFSRSKEGGIDYVQLKKDGPGLVAAAAHATIPSWSNMVLMVSLIFGGCCANVRDDGAVSGQR
jgi:UDP-xylose/UDP-N-acetylglucosamine transporter B4